MWINVWCGCGGGEESKKWQSTISEAALLKPTDIPPEPDLIMKSMYLALHPVPPYQWVMQCNRIHHNETHNHYHFTVEYVQFVDRRNE
jgi:hypothetical protein